MCLNGDGERLAVPWQLREKRVRRRILVTLVTGHGKTRGYPELIFVVPEIGCGTDMRKQNSMSFFVSEEIYTISKRMINNGWDGYST